MDLEKKVITVLQENKIEYALTLPCAKIKRLIILASENFEHIPLSREEEGIGIASGLFQAGKRSILMMQSGGIGNSLNALLSLAQVYQIPLPMIISWRGVYKEKIEAQKPMGEFLPAIFDAVKLPRVLVEEEKDLWKIKDAINRSYEEKIPIGILISPKFWEASTPEEDMKIKQSLEAPSRKDTTNIFQPSIINEPTLIRYEAIEAATEYLKGKIIISNIGIPSKELYELCEQDSNFYMLGSFGMASPIGLGVALAQEDEVIVLDGDASILTNPNILGTISLLKEKCKNLTIVLLDNGTCGSTGNQETLALTTLDLEVIAQAFGISATQKAYTKEEILEALQQDIPGPKLIHVIIKAGQKPEIQNVPLTAIEIKKRFMHYLKKP